MDNPGYKTNNSKTFRVFLSVILSVIILIFGYLYYTNEERIIREQKITELKAIANLKTIEIEDWFSDEVFDAGLISKNLFLREILKKYRASQSGEYERYLFAQTESIRIEHGYKEVRLYMPDSNGKIKPLAFKQSKPDTVLAGLALEAYRNERTINTDIYSGDNGKKIRISFASPVFDENNNVLSCIVYSLDPEDFLYPLIQAWPTESKTSETLLLRREGDSIRFINRLRHKTINPLSFRLPVSNKEIPAVQAALGKRGEYEGTDYRGVRVFAYLDEIRGTNWFIVSKIDKSEMLASLKEKALIVFIFTFLMIAFVIGIVSLVYNSKQKRVYRELWESNEEFKTTLYSIGDAVITTDEKGFVKFLNPVAENLTDWNISEATGRPLVEVFRILNAKTRIPVENPVNIVIGSGKIVGLANHTMLISKNGAEYQIADSAAPIINPEGNIIGVVLVFRNVTDEYLMREKIKASEETFRSIVESSPMGIHLYEVDENDNVIFVGANPAADKILNTENSAFIGKTIEEAFPPLAGTDVPNKYKQAALNGESWFTEQINYDHGGISGAFEVHAFRIAPKRAAVLFNDITIRKQSEEKLMKSEAMLSAAITQSPAGIIIADAPDVKIRYANPAAFGIRGSSDKPLTEIDVSELTNIWNTYYDDTITPYNFDELPLSRAIIEGITTRNAELIIKNDKNETRWVSANAAPIKDSLGNIISGIIVFNDITERKKAEDALRDSEAKYRNLLETMQEGIWAIDSNAITILVNYSMAEMLGYSQEEILGRHLFDFMDEQGIELAKSNLERRKQGIREQHDFELIRKDNQRIYVSMVVSPMNDIYGNYTGAIAGVQDITSRKQIEAAMAESESKFRSLFDNINVGVALHEIITDKNNKPVDFIWIDANSVYESLTDLKKEEIIGKRGSVILPVTEHKWIEIFGNVALNGRPLILENYSESLKKYFELHVYSPKHNQFAIAMKDITERITTEEALRASEERYRKLSEDMPIYISTFLPDGTLLYVNQALAVITGHTAEELTGRNFFDFLSDDDRYELKNRLNNMIRKNQTVTHEQIYKGINGNVRYQQWTNRAFFDGDELKYFQAVGIDTTDRKLAEIALRQSEDKMSSIFRVAPAGIGVVKDRVIVEVNPRLCEMTGYSKEELMGKSAEVLYPSIEEFEFVGREKYKQIAEKGTGSVETKWKRKEGAIIDIILSSTPIDLNNLSEGVTFTALDITQRKQDEAELLKAKEKAEENDKLKTAFLQNLSHEIRTPLNGILGFSELINEIDLKRDDIRNYTSIILQSGRRLLNIVNNVLDISKIQTGQINIEKRLFSVNSLFFDLYTFFGPQAKSRNINLSFTIKDNKKLLLNSDEAKLHQIMTNLINNSLKFTKKGFIEFECDIDGDYLLFAVRDSGIGISPELFDRIFDRFVQAEVTSNREFEGAGLGLAICKGLVEKMGGRIWVESEPGVNTCFYFTLPYESDYYLQGSLSDSKTKPRVKFKGKILIADDDFNSFYYLNRILENSEIEIFHAENGEEAIQIVSSNPDINIALIDIRMPKMDGIEALQNIRKINPKLPAIAQTAYAFSEEREKILRIGFDEYLSKPIEKAKFLELLEKYLPY